MKDTREDSESDDEELDMASEKFNPLKALYSKKNRVPLNAKKFDNLSIFASRLKTAGNTFDSDLEKATTSRKSKKDETKREEVDEEKYHVTSAGRIFLKEQGKWSQVRLKLLLINYFSAPIHRGPKAKYNRNILHRMDNFRGPTSLLNKFKVNKTRVKIYIRKQHGIRGHVTGFIEAFDKHFNIALVDCIEVWKRRKFKFSDSKVALLGPPEDCSDELAAMGINIPEITTKSINRKVVECSRVIPQMMIRGEEVILVGEVKDIESQSVKQEIENV